jgi:serine/threonine protein kinase
MLRRLWVSCNNRCSVFGEASVAPVIGTHLNQYRLDEIVGEGGMGVVYRALDMNLERTVAVKVLGATLREDADFVARFRQEARIQAGLNHPNIATLFDFFVWDDMPVAVMEFIKGETLRTLVDRNGPIPAHLALPVFIQTLRGVAAGHKAGIIHRDLKPSNLMITDEGTVKITDFGIAKVRNNTGLTRVSTRVGSTSYMAPEQILGRPVDERTDIYILGGTLYELLTGRPPFQGLSQFEIDSAHVREPPSVPAEFHTQIPPGVIAAVIRALAKDPSDRFATAEEFIGALPDLHGVPYVAPADTDATRVPQQVGAVKPAVPRPAEVPSQRAVPRVGEAPSQRAATSAGEVPSKRAATRPGEVLSQPAVFRPGNTSSEPPAVRPEAVAAELTKHRAEAAPSEPAHYRADVPPPDPTILRGGAPPQEPTIYRGGMPPSEPAIDRGGVRASEPTIYRGEAAAPDPTIFRGEAPPPEPTLAQAGGAKRAVTIVVASGLLVFLVVGFVLFATRRPVIGTIHQDKQLADAPANVPVGPQPSAHAEPTAPPAPIPQKNLTGMWTGTYVSHSRTTLLQLQNLQLEQAANGDVTGRFDYKTSDSGGEDCTLEKSSYSTQSRRLRLITHCHDPRHPKYLNVPLEFDDVDPGTSTIEGGRLAFHMADDIVVTLERSNGI